MKNNTRHNKTAHGVLKPNVIGANGSCELLKNLRMNYEDVIKLLIKIVEERDTYTKGHSVHVMKYAMKIAGRLGLSKDQTDELREASLLHDIGKIAIDERILNKPGPLTKDELTKVLHHPEVGARIINQSRALRSLVPAIRHHHAKFSGGGYPNPKLKKRHIPLFARIICVADAWDAMRSDRAYRKALSRRQAVAQLKGCAGTQFDPQIVNAFLCIL